MKYPAGCSQPIKELSCRISTVYQWMVLQDLHSLSLNYLAGFPQPITELSCRISIAYEWIILQDLHRITVTLAYNCIQPELDFRDPWQGFHEFA
jgi:hypothetical protein